MEKKCWFGMLILFGSIFCCFLLFILLLSFWNDFFFFFFSSFALPSVFHFYTQTHRSISVWKEIWVIVHLLRSIQYSCSSYFFLLLLFCFVFDIFIVAVLAHIQKFMFFFSSLLSIAFIFIISCSLVFFSRFLATFIA